MTDTNRQPVYTPEQVEQLMAEHRELDARVAADAPAVLPACPAWCSERDAHGLDGYDHTDDPTRFVHDRAHFSSATVYGWIGQDEHHHPDGRVVLSAPYILLEDRAEPVTTSAEARQVAASILNAADLLDRVNAGVAAPATGVVVWAPQGWDDGLTRAQVADCLEAASAAVRASVAEIKARRS